MDMMNCAAAAQAAQLSTDELNRLVQVARRAADRGAAELMSHYGRLSSIENKGRQGDLVTNADLAAERIVLDVLAEETPTIAVLAEESGAEGSQDGLRWCIDPLDGTTNFAHGYPFFATSIGLTYQQIPVLGAIAVPFLRETYWGAPGVGAHCNDQPIHVTDCTRLEDALLVTGFAYDRHQRLDNNYAEFCWFTHRTRGVRRGGAAAVDLAFVAAGRQDGYWERGLSPWDLAAGVAIVELAGGMISGYDGQPFSLNDGRVVAAGPRLHPAITEVLDLVKPLSGKDFGAPEVTAMGS
ncbi:MAG: Fructose-1,6-bisphosphatase/inositol-1-monophosphatase [Synechococcus sp. CC9902]|mgnify:CR=1 FL=1|nr:MAG: Fructose-1,6-bisphosphatase/inositol-1-monophosphatase [Synechococcus sp. CC9902]|tara:strand:- start:1179 stop:2066 length:888 start_codon:yes stop_codon:yes gene_type:complete